MAFTLKKQTKVNEAAEEVVVKEVVAKEVKEIPAPAKVPDGGTSWFMAK